jgi:FkbM family methyltransferase
MANYSWKHFLLSQLNKVLLIAGFRVSRYSVHIRRKDTKVFFDHNQPLTSDFLIRVLWDCDSFVDIGCNRGKFAEHVQKLRPELPWLIVEPIPYLMDQLMRKFNFRKDLTVFKQIALDDSSGSKIFYVTTNDGQSSSLLGLGQKHLEASPDTTVSDEIRVETSTLDELGTSVPGKRVFMKIDVQGKELDVLQAGLYFLKNVYAIHIEVSMQHLYDGDTLGYEIWKFLEDNGFILYGIDPWFRSAAHSGALIQADFFFVRLDS